MGSTYEPWLVLIVSYVALGFVWYGNHSIIEFNLNPPAHSELVGTISPVIHNSDGRTHSLITFIEESHL